MNNENTLANQEIFLDKNKKILIIGLGLLGGSYAMALSKKGYHVSAITDLQSSVDYALSHGMIEKGYAYVDEETVEEADLLIFALYPHIFLDWLNEYGHLIKKGALITDVTGVKGCIVDKVQNMLGKDKEFIAAHPMAGKEVCGVENSDDAIFKNANYIVVPTEKNTEKAIKACEELGHILGFSFVSRLSVKEHDEMIAYLSQLTHCIAVSLMCCSDNENISKYTGDSFRDLTRIARINDEMWSELFLLNKEALLEQMDLFAAQFMRLHNALKAENREEIREMMRTSTKRRICFDKRKEQ